MSKTTKTPAPAPAPAAPAPAPASASSEAVANNPELTATPNPVPPGPLVAPHVPAPIPPLEANPTLPKEAQPAQQGSLTPAQVAQRTDDGRKPNPAIKSAPAPGPVAPAPLVDSRPKNAEGFVPGEEVSPEDVLAHEHRRMHEKFQK